MEETFVEYLGYTATFFTLLLFISGIPVCLSIRQKQSTGELSSVTFISGVLMCYVWYKYGLLINDFNVYFVNFLGFLIHIVYSGIFIYYCPNTKRRPIKLQILVSIMIIATLYVIQNKSSSPSHTIHYTGLLGSVLSIAFAASPLVSLRTVFKSKSADILPFYTIFSVFIVASLWSFYGVIKGDVFLIFTNGTNGIISLFQLSLFFLYPSNKKEGGPLLKESII